MICEETTCNDSAAAAAAEKTTKTAPAGCTASPLFSTIALEVSFLSLIELDNSSCPLERSSESCFTEMAVRDGQAQEVGKKEHEQEALVALH